MYTISQDIIICILQRDVPVIYTVYEILTVDNYIDYRIEYYIEGHSGHT